MSSPLLRLLPMEDQLPPEWAAHDMLREIFPMQQSFYQQVGYAPPWIGYIAIRGDQAVGTCSFKGPPREGKVEIAYFTFPEFEGQGIGTEMARLLTQIGQEAGQKVRLTARTLMEENASTAILRKNGYQLLGEVIDPEDGPVWEWEKL
ncbi:MAG: GNAT family N-acetyltransferase [Bacteroidota bacterium]